MGPTNVGTGFIQIFILVLIQSLSHIKVFETSWTAAHQLSPSFTISRSLPSHHLNHVHWVSDNIQPSYPLSSPLLLPSIFPRVFSSESAIPIRWPKYCSFSIGPCNEYSGLISFRIDCFDLLATQGTLKSLLQHHSSKPSVLGHSAFIIVQLSHLYMTTGKTIALTRWTFAGKVMSLLFNMLPRFVIAFLSMGIF